MTGILKLHLDSIFPSLTDDLRKYEAISKKITDARIAKGMNVAVKDVYASLLEYRDPESGVSFTNEELISESGVLLLAGKSMCLSP
jgi:cytochrome P450